MDSISANPFNRENLAGEVLEGWQKMLDLAAKLLAVPSGLITRVDRSEIEVFLSSDSAGNPYEQGLKTHYPDSGFYCEWVVRNRQGMYLPDARLDPLWKDNAAIQLNMTSYLGMPIVRPDGEMFGTICFLNSQEVSHSETIAGLVGQFKNMIELTLKIVYANEEMKRKEHFIAGLSRIFPICAYCKKVCSDQNEWIPVESYIKGISGKSASHGICPLCYERELQNLES
jgi:hypothetical protein